MNAPSYHALRIAEHYKHLTVADLVWLRHRVGLVPEAFVRAAQDAVERREETEQSALSS